MDDHLSGTVEGTEIAIEVVLLLTGPTLGRGPQIYRVDRHFQQHDAERQATGHQNTDSEDKPRPSGADCSGPSNKEMGAKEDEKNQNRQMSGRSEGELKVKHFLLGLFRHLPNWFFFSLCSS